ncbi:unnamed protein product, partial [Pylaiella littoralis]
ERGGRVRLREAGPEPEYRPLHEQRLEAHHSRRLRRLQGEVQGSVHRVGRRFLLPEGKPGRRLRSQRFSTRISLRRRRKHGSSRSRRHHPLGHTSGQRRRLASTSLRARHNGKLRGQRASIPQRKVSLSSPARPERYRPESGADRLEERLQGQPAAAGERPLPSGASEKRRSGRVRLGGEGVLDHGNGQLRPAAVHADFAG